jgi:geranylgeranyl reductase family protein
VESADIVVAGAGPAGASAALELERLGISFSLIDRENFPRPKICAGILPPAVELETGPLPQEAFERRVRGYFLHSISGLEFESAFPTNGYSVDRVAFDSWLLSRLKTRPAKASVEGVTERQGSVAVRTTAGEISCRVLIGADGAGSRIRESAGLEKGLSAFACQGVIHQSPSEILKRTGDRFHVFYTVPGGYGWVAPHKERLLAGIGSVFPEHTGKNALAGFLELPALRELTAGTEPEEIQYHSIPMSGPNRKIGRGRTILAGDAGGFVFPGTGEGIRYAMRSGTMAARAAAGWLAASGNPSDLQTTYRLLLEDEGLMSLRDVDFQKVLRTPQSAEKYVRRLIALGK